MDFRNLTDDQLVELVRNLSFEAGQRGWAVQVAQVAERKERDQKLAALAEEMFEVMGVRCAISLWSSDEPPAPSEVFKQAVRQAIIAGVDAEELLTAVREVSGGSQS